MEKSQKDILADLDREIRDLKDRIADIERKVDKIRESSAADEESAEHLELVHEDYLSDISEITPSVQNTEKTLHDVEPVEPDMVKDVSEQEDKPEEAAGVDNVDSAGEPEESLFGTVSETTSHRKVKTFNDVNASRLHRTVGDAVSDRPAWYTDMPGPEVRDVRSAISLNDRVMFISTLFREDSMLFQDVVGRINSLTSLDKAVAYLEATFPEWDADSELVYRFMMAVRRKIR